MRTRANDRLKFLLGWDLCNKDCIWPSTNLDVTGNKIDLNDACAVGLAHRHELMELRLLACRTCSETLPLVRAVLAQTDKTPMLTPTHLHDMSSDRDLYLRKEQIEHILGERERSATVEICDAVAAVEAQLLRVSSALRKVQTWEDRAEELKREEAAGKATRVDAGLARLDGIDAKTEYLREVVLWKRSLIRLAAVQGRLAAECECATFDAGVAGKNAPAKP